MFIDKVKIYVKAGNGGNGCVSFHREKYVSHGGPDGGDGGKGGNIVLRIENGSNTLFAYKNRKKFVAANGGDGIAGKKHGATADDVILPVPPGTVVRDAQSGQIIKDMSNCEDFILCKGGRGGWGNRHFATPTRQIPRFAKMGMKGEEKEVVLELKMLADVGLVGLPSAGKSSILSVISSARPKIAAYHFTTLSPNLGVVSYGENQGFVCADIPGLIEGAAEGAGLGLDFLRHIDRCRMLIHVVDISGIESTDPIADIETITAELEKYSPELARRPRIIAANKYDAFDPELIDLEAFESYIDEKGYELIYVSAATLHNIDTLIQMTAERLRLLPPLTIYEKEYVEEDLSAPLDKTVKVRKTNGRYEVEGDWLYRFMETINFADRDQLMYFEKVLRENGVIKALEDAGCGEGDTVSMYDFEFDFIE
ncbi:MAG: GTPase ObgE [Clostridia bacterium]|nr:GTPase ObgE [Clostridia bacterium]